MLSSAVVSEGITYVGSLDDKIYALNAADGKLVWSYLTGGEISSSPAVFNGIVYVGSSDDKVYALDASNGKSTVELHYWRCCLLFPSRF